MMTATDRGALRRERLAWVTRPDPHARVVLAGDEDRHEVFFNGVRLKGISDITITRHGDRFGEMPRFKVDMATASEVALVPSRMVELVRELCDMPVAFTQDDPRAELRALLEVLDG